MEALIIVDIQNDFLPGGSLSVEGGDDIIPVVNSLQEHFDLIVATQDWHPTDHGSFASNHKGQKQGDTVLLSGIDQVLWPDHCVQETKGAEFAPGLHTEKVNEVIRKGTDPQIDSYSGFFDNEHRKSTGLHKYLQEKMVDKVYICGLATDVCVRFTALDAIQLGYTVFLVVDATRAVDGQAGYDNTLKELKEKGVKLVNSTDLPG